MVAAVCVVAAGVGGMKAYNNQSEENVLLAENVEALAKEKKAEVIIDTICRYEKGENCYLGGGWRAKNAIRTVD